MKKVLTLVAFAGMVTFVACGPSAEEKAAADKKKNDSIAGVMQKAKDDSVAAVAAKEKAKADSANAAMEKMKADSAKAAEEGGKKGGKGKK
jgi:hypothetical protein